MKSYLRLLLSKFFKKSDLNFIIGQTMPSGWDNRTVIKQTELGSLEGTYRVPENGYFCINCGNGIISVQVSASVSSRMQINEANPLQWPCVYLPIAKGGVVSYEVTASAHQSEGSTVFFVPAIGSVSN